MPVVIAVHGAGSGPEIFDHWKPSFGPADLVAVDLHAGIDVAAAGMDDYAGRVVDAIGASEPPVAVCGWSMGGLVAAMAALRTDVDALIMLEPSPPAEVQGEASVASAGGTFDPEETYGAFPPGIAARPESTRARVERKRGISVPRVPTHTLVVFGDEFAEERGHAIARHYRCDAVHVPGANHWDLVLEDDAVRVVSDYLSSVGFIP